MTSSRRTTLRTTAAAVLAVAGLGLTACESDTPDTVDSLQEAEGVPEEEILEGVGPVEPYVGPYDSAFVDARDDYTDTEVVLTGEVQEIVSPVGFTIIGTEDADTDPLLVFYDPAEAAPEAGEAVVVTGTIREVFNPPVAEANLREGPGPDELAYYHGQPFMRADNVAVATPEDMPTTG